jgi:hypothetical protein
MRKPLRKSRTLWINTLTMAAAVLMLIPNFLTDLDINDHLAMRISAVVMLLNNTITIWLRIFANNELPKN